MRYASVSGEKRLPEKGLWGTCRLCGETVISKCGTQVVHHWAHKAGSDCDPWSEAVGPWHLEWQDYVQPEFVEVIIGPHRADIVGAKDCVIELQHSPIPLDQIAAREDFYGNMVWVFDATERFEMITVGRRVFFAFRRTKHISTCTKPVFLDFGSVLVEVEEFTTAVAKMDGFGRTRSREWFAEQFLSDRLQDGATPPSFRSSARCKWHKDMRYSRTKHASRWNDPETNAAVTIPKGSMCIPLDWYFKRVGEPRVYEWERIVAEHEQLSNGWTKQELNAMKQFLHGELLILDGLLRLMPSPAEEIKVDMTVSATKDHLARVEKHIAAGRLPILKETTKQQLIKNAEAYESRKYGGLLESQSRGKTAGDQQHRLF
ncbi:MAG: competence protein CoiA family protein [Dehalococcoidia bacterium]